MTDPQNPMAARPSDGPSAVRDPEPKRKIPSWGKIAIGTLAGLIVGGAMASAGAAGQDVASPAPAPTVTVTSEPRVVEVESDDADDVRAELTVAEAKILACQTTVTVMDEAVQVVLGAFDRQITATYDAAVFGATQALIDEQNAINAEIESATAILSGAPGCR